MSPGEKIENIPVSGKLNTRPRSPLLAISLFCHSLTIILSRWELSECALTLVRSAVVVDDDKGHHVEEVDWLRCVRLWLISLVQARKALLRLGHKWSAGLVGKELAMDLRSSRCFRASAFLLCS
ncbi:hypothetical protein NDU88_005823 [Pleurodeles waltl]|uniref:Uncharacterized protein n=1 Tax=Pleurodeles waltl TaxID=8319 RepID=A0AAV7L5Q9_PLEWA|nr:hypothetical protein NDU88_005823 [Pleurodeles waltl]